MRPDVTRPQRREREREERANRDWELLAYPPSYSSGTTVGCCLFSRVSFGVRAASPAGQSYLIRFRYRMTDVLPPLLSDGRAANFVVSHAGYIYVGARAHPVPRPSPCPSKTLPEPVYHNTCRWCNHVKHRRRDIARRCAGVNKFNVASRGSPQPRVKQQSAILFFTPRGVSPSRRKSDEAIKSRGLSRNALENLGTRRCSF